MSAVLEVPATIRVGRSDLILDRALVDGRWIAASDGATFAVTNPADDSPIVDVANAGAAEAKAAVDAAQAAFVLWRERPAKERAQLLRKWFELILRNQEDLARIISLEQGKP